MSQATVSLSGITTPATVENRELEMLIIASIKTLKQGNKQEKIRHMWRRWGTPQNFLAINWWTLKNPKRQTFEKNEKNCWRYHHFTHVYQKHNHMRYSSWDTEWERIFCHFGPFFALLLHYWLQKLKFGKNVKNTQIYILSFYTCVP